MRLLLTAPRSELGRVLAAVAGDVRQGGAPVIVNLALQAPNSLLHDGRAWWDGAPAHMLASTRRVLAAARRKEGAFLVHASYAFLQATECGDRAGNRLWPIIEAAREGEEMVLHSDIDACVVRLGYLYGPQSRDVRAYRRAFQLHRPYWAGPPRNLQHHLHTDDAAQALLTAGAQRAGGTSYATDGTPASFADFMDHFAHLVGRSHPLHIPRQARLLVRPVVRQAHMEMVELAATGAAAPRLRGWTPAYRGYREGLAQVVGAWNAER